MSGIDAARPIVDDPTSPQGPTRKHLFMPLTATEPRRAELRSLSPHGFHRVIYYEWGAPDNPRVVVCVHGVGRNGRDFDVLGEALAPTHRILAIDMPGRGESDWLADPNDYIFPTYLTTLVSLIARSGAESVDWIGTSMGGLLGIVAAAQPDSPIARLVVNDVGPVIEPVALERIRAYFGANPDFASYDEIAHYIRTISAPFGRLTDVQWEHVTRSNVRQRTDGRWRLAYDPGIAVPFKATTSAPSDLWWVWDAIRCPTLVLRGAESDLLSAATAAQMGARGPKPRIIEFADVGHAPMLLTPAEIDPVARFLRADAPRPAA
jgi:pimeloyl-ACP methyl ester carboxylesterase